MPEKELLFSLSKDKGDFIVQPFKGSGKGGQKRNKTMSCCRIIHQASGAISECQEERSFDQNRRKAFKRLIEKPGFIKWHQIECAKRMGYMANVEADVNKAMADKNLLIEICVDGKWMKQESEVTE